MLPPLFPLFFFFYRVPVEALSSLIELNFDLRRHCALAKFADKSSHFHVKY